MEKKQGQDLSLNEVAFSLKESQSAKGVAMIFRGLLVGIWGGMLLASCAHVGPDSGLRRPSSEEDQSAIVRTYIQRLLDFDRRESQAIYYFKRFPPVDLTDVGGGANFATAYDKAVKELSESSMQEVLNNSSEESGEERDVRVSEVIQKTFADLSFRDRLQFATICTSAGRGVGDKTRLASLIKSWELCQRMKGIFSPNEMREALMAIPAQPKKVKYDGDLGFHIYQDSVLEGLVRVIAVSANWDRSRFAEVFRALPKEKKAIFATDKDGLGAGDATEPFDLIANMTTAFIMSGLFGKDETTNMELNKIQISKLSQKALSRLFGMFDRDSDHITRNPSLSMLRNDSNMTVFCANGFFETEEAQGVTAKGNFRTAWLKSRTGTDLVETWSPFFDLERMKEEKIHALPFICNTNSYRFALRNRPVEEIPEPVPLDFSRAQGVNALMTISLVSEIDRSAVEKGRFLISKLGGWKIEEDLKEVSTKEFFREEFKKADAYIPVMHAMDVNYFNIGTGQSLSLRLSRQVKDQKGVSKTLYLTILFPLGSSRLAPLVMGAAELAEIMDARHQVKDSPLFLMNNSCGSEKTLPAWALVYRKAFELRKARGEVSHLSQARDFPHIIGSKRYFSTSSVAQIFGHAEYPLKSLEMLTAGKSVGEIVEFLEQPPSKGFFGALTSMILPGGDETLESESRSFEPEYSGRYPELRSFGGFEVIVSGRGIKGENVY
ncbi:MAG: hypothetical protein KF789_07185 [Bdellovibrionaceae bacterium]|nr:hypothetical protein [Pseudobdellovibrionaceae bacterium]